MNGIVIARYNDYAGERPERLGALAELPPAAILNRLCGELAIGIIRAVPFRYLRHVTAHLYGMWWMPQWRTVDEVDTLASDLRAGRVAQARIDGHGERLLRFVSRRSIGFLLMARATLMVVLVASLLGLLVPLKLGIREPILLAWAFASLNLHAALLLVCAVQAASWRYSIVWWAYALVCLAAAVAVSLQRMARGRSTATP